MRSADGLFNFHKKIANIIILASLVVASTSFFSFFFYLLIILSTQELIYISPI